MSSAKPTDAPQVDAGRAPLRTVTVATAAGERYPVLVGAGALRELPELLRRRAPASLYAVITDETVRSLHGEGLMELLAGHPVELLSFPPGESSKTRARWADLTDGLLDLGVGRDGCVIAFGGGVVGDLAGFVAATYMRGLPVIQIPTSLVAMIDSSVGGKTGVDTPSGKNLVGAFHPPRAVVADPRLAETLPRRERSQGLAEAVKHGAILDPAYLERLERESGALLTGDPEVTAWAVHRSVELKAGVVSEDELEAGLREILNFGHTLGHALELVSDYRIPHGDAVAIGMVMEARVGEAIGVTRQGTAARLEEVLLGFDLPTRRPPEVEIAQLVAATRTDKKVRAGRARYVLLEALGRVVSGAARSRSVEPDQIEAALAE